MALETRHAILLKQRLSPITVEGIEPDAATLSAMNQYREGLARLWFDDDITWPTDWTNEEVLAALEGWFGDNYLEFEQMMASDLAGFLGLLGPAITVWSQQEADATKETGLLNKDGFERDPIPGTQYYRMINGEYLYSGSPDGEGDGWLTIKARIAAQDPNEAHYVEEDDNWQRISGGVQEYQDRKTGLWRRLASEPIGSDRPEEKVDPGEAAKKVAAMRDTVIATLISNHPNDAEYIKEAFTTYAAEVLVHKIANDTTE